MKKSDKMENTLTVYFLEWHNHKNYSDRYFKEDFDAAKKAFEECSSRKSFNRLLLKKVTFKGERPIYNKAKLIDLLRTYDLDFSESRIKTEYILDKEISNEGCAPLLDTCDLANMC